MPTILSVKPTNSALIMPAIFGSRSRSGRQACLKRYGGSARKVYYRRLASYGRPPISNDKYSSSSSNVFRMTTEKPLSTVSIDVDTASYSNVRRYLKDGLRPPVDAVRVEDFINYFKYNYPEPESGEIFSMTAECAPCPWNTDNKLLLIGLKGREMIKDKKKVSSNYVFLIDISGSMSSQNKLPLLKRSLNLMIDNLSKNDRIAIVTYASNTRILMDAVSGKDKKSIRETVDTLSAGGCTYGESGIKLAYRVAEKNFIKGGNNRVILATDGDFNVGVTNNEELKQLVIKKKQSGVFLTVIGMGAGNLNDAMMETISNHGNGNYFYIDSFKEARKVFTTDLDKNLFTIAKDVKIQIEFNPAFVAEYRLIGYENRVMKKEDFNNDKKDAGEIGCGHTVTYLYEIVPGNGTSRSSVDPLKYQKTKPKPIIKPINSKEMFTLKLRYKKPEEETSRLLEFPVRYKTIATKSPGKNFNMAAASAAFAMRLREPNANTYDFDTILRQIASAKGKDQFGYRSEFSSLVKNAEAIY